MVPRLANRNLGANKPVRSEHGAVGPVISQYLGLKCGKLGNQVSSSKVARQCEKSRCKCFPSPFSQ